MSLSSGLVTITFIDNRGNSVIAHWAVVPRFGDYVELRRAAEDGSDIGIVGKITTVVWRDEGVSISVR
jgi:hypothetical protein